MEVENNYFTVYITSLTKVFLQHKRLEPKKKRFEERVKKQSFVKTESKHAPQWSQYHINLFFTDVKNLNMTRVI